MTRAVTGLVIVLFAGGVLPTPGNVQCFGHQVQLLRFGVRAQDDNPRPWMQGTVEIGCNRSGEQPKGDTTTEWKACACHHGKKDGGKCDDETQGRAWDPRCATRCTPKHCMCAPNPCGDTN